MKKYRVGFWVERGGTCTIDAKSVEDAEEKVHALLEDNDDTDLEDVDISSRDYGSQDAEEIV